MSFESPIQPVVGRGRSLGPSILAVLLLAVGLAAAHPWDPGAPIRPDASALAAALASASVSPPRSDSTGSPSPVVSPSDTITPALYGDPPAADQFQATWSVVGVRELASGGYSIAQQALDPRPTARTGMLESATCDLGPQPDVGFLPASTLRLIGVVAPNAGRGWIRLSLIDGSIARAFAVLVSYPPGTEDLAVGLFGTSAYDLWPQGEYRFYAVDDSGTGRYLYACVGG